MNTKTVEQEFHQKVSTKIRLLPEGVERYQVFTPFQFDDGDHLAIVLKKQGDQWVFTDEAHTYMHLSYSMDTKDLQKGTRQKIITNTLSVFSVNDIEGELILPVKNGEFGNALYSFIQALLKISDVTYLTRERTRTTFLQDFKDLISSSIAPQRHKFDWYDAKLDPAGKYKIDCRINGMNRPLFINALSNDNNTRDATIALMQYEKWEIPFSSLAIFENQETIQRNVLARFTDVSGKQFSNLVTNKAQITNYIREYINGSIEI